MASFKREDIDHFMVNDIHLPTRTLFWGSSESKEGDESGVDYKMAERGLKGLHILNNDGANSDKPITILFKTPGGDWESGIALYDAIKACKAHVTVHVFGGAHSMGSIIIQAADDRLISYNSKIMIHYGEIFLGGHPKKVKNWMEDERKNQDWMRSLYIDRIRQAKPHFSQAKLDKLLDFDTVYDADGALENGLVDGILLPNGKIFRLGQKSRRQKRA